MKKNKTIIAIDPGFFGAIAIIDKNDTVNVFSMPFITVDSTVKLKSGKYKQKKLYVTRRISDIISAHINNDPIIVLEKVHAMPRDGVVSAFAFGEGYGIIKGIAAALNVPLIEVTPQAWKKHFMSGYSADKKNSVIVVTKLYPELTNMVYNNNNTPLDGVADAILIGMYYKDAILKYEADFE